MKIQEIRNRLQKLANQEKAKVLQGFFKTGPGQYGEGDVFLGVTVPVLRNLAKECRETSINDAVRLLKSQIHEERLLSLLVLMNCYLKGSQSTKNKIYSLYLRNTRYINNWDLVDLSAPNIVGNYLADKSRRPLYELAHSRDLWKRRIAVLATFYFIRQNDFADTLKICEILVYDSQDLIQKAVGWMLREVGKRNVAVEKKFLLDHYQKMPRTMLRYAIERFPEPERRSYLDGTV